MINSPPFMFKHMKNDERVAMLFQCLRDHTQQKLYFSFRCWGIMFQRMCTSIWDTLYVCISLVWSRRWNWYLTPVVNFGEVRKAQLAKSTLQAGAPGIFSNLLRSVQMLRECGVQKAVGSYCTYSSLVKLQPWFLSLRWKRRPAFGQNCSLGA